MALPSRAVQYGTFVDRSTHLFFLSRQSPETKWATGSFVVPADPRIVVSVCVVGLAPAPGRISINLATATEARHGQGIYIHVVLARY